ncbi:MAG: BrnA antitoxin family protein [Alphaproteobacteria bacterium]
MADDDTRHCSLDEIRQMRAKGLTKATPHDAPEIELGDDFWEHAATVETAASRKTSVHLRVDPETLEFFRAGGKGHLTRMAKVLRAYAQSRGRSGDRRR